MNDSVELGCRKDKRGQSTNELGRSEEKAQSWDQFADAAAPTSSLSPDRVRAHSKYVHRMYGVYGVYFCSMRKVGNSETHAII